MSLDTSQVLSVLIPIFVLICVVLVCEGKCCNGEKTLSQDSDYVYTYCIYLCRPRA